MIEFFNSWIQGIVIAVIIATIIEMLLPKGNNKKYIQVVIGIYIVFTIISPIIQNFFQKEWTISLKDYWEELEGESTQTSTALEGNNQKNIQEIYKRNLEKDMQAKIEKQGYIVQNIEIQLSKKEEEYEIMQVEIKAKKDKIRLTNSKQENKIYINEVEKIEISVEENQIQQEDLRELNTPEKNAIKQIITSNYEIPEENITIT